ncbi:hypothetical protein PVK06_029736 [Gossypium arboreum]|uniref:Reverse transcriptase n=1 Tax=Gossypium arboreum TaxID=29729 RepID=A0ABR0NLD6_GOSAR|nr:hypothetical protein PVK06_029736 [Gossypium arboreum]
MNGRLLNSVKVSRKGPQVSHLFFADDCILFEEATSRGENLFKEILREFKNCSGQGVNFDKSTVFFSTNPSEEDRKLVVNIFRVQSLNEPERYLGLPNMVGRRKKESFQNLKDRLKKRKVGKLTLIYLEEHLGSERWEAYPHLLGRAFGQRKDFLKKGCAGEWAMVTKFRSGNIAGYRGSIKLMEPTDPTMEVYS